MKRLALAVLMAGISTAAMADSAIEHPYIGLDYQWGSFKPDNGGSASPSAILFKVGTELNRYFAVEMQGGVGLSSDQISRPGVNYDVKADNMYGIYLRPQLPLGDWGSIYLLGGYSYVRIKAEASSPGTSLSGAQTGWDSRASWGGGVDFSIYHNVRLNVDYIDLVDEYTSVNAGIRIPIN